MNVKEFLKNIDLFSNLHGDQIRRLSEMAISSIFEKGRHIFYEGDQAFGFYVVQLGRVKIFKLSSEGKEQILHVMGSGESFAEVPMFAGGRYPADAEAVDDSVLLFFSREAFTDLIRREPSLAINMMASLSKRLLHLTTLVENLSLKEVPGRLAAYLLHMSEQKNEADNLDLNISKGQLANILGTSPETLSRTLGKMSAQGLIHVKGRCIRLMNRKDIKEIASGIRSKD